MSNSSSETGFVTRVLHCPWSNSHNESVCLRDHVLSSEEKKYLVDRLIPRGDCTVNQLQIQYTLPRRRLYKYKQKANSSMGILYEKGGRPKCLDDKSQSDIVQYLIDVPTVSEKELRQMIRDTHKRSWHDKIINCNNNNQENVIPLYKAISFRTVCRYSAVLRSKAQVSTPVPTPPSNNSPSSLLYISLSMLNNFAPASWFVGNSNKKI